MGFLAPLFSFITQVIDNKRGLEKKKCGENNGVWYLKLMCVLHAEVEGTLPLEKMLHEIFSTIH